MLCHPVSLLQLVMKHIVPTARNTMVLAPQGHYVVTHLLQCVTVEVSHCFDEIGHTLTVVIL